jgi:glycerol-3-phosphate dehydrogenase (NAD(P)+)
MLPSVPGAVSLAILGAGNWGTTLAVMQADAGREVVLCTHDAALAALIDERRENVRSLPGVRLSDAVRIQAGYRALSGASMVVLAIASEHVRATCRQLRGILDAGTLLVSAAKGLETGSALRVSEVVAEELPACFPTLAVLSGPNLAGELAAGLPAAAVVASNDRDAAAQCALSLATRLFRIYASDDVIGVELGGSLKNVVAIAAGICDGLAMGTNGKAAIVTRGLAEIVRLGVACGANPLTFAGLSGYGDLFATCVSPLSRNHYLGEAIGRGRAPSEVLSSMTMVAEGVNTARAARVLATRHQVELPIADQVYAVLFEGKNPLDAMQDLLSRLARDERTGEPL